MGHALGVAGSSLPFGPVRRGPRVLATVRNQSGCGVGAQLAKVALGRGSEGALREVG